MIPSLSFPSFSFFLSLYYDIFTNLWNEQLRRSFVAEWLRAGDWSGPISSRKDIDFKNSRTDGTDTSFHPPKVSPPANFSIYFTPIGSSRVENGANPFRWLESMTDLSYIGWICEPRLIGNAKEISRTDPPRKELDDFSSRNEQRKDESEWINARTDRSGQTWPNRFATSKNRESRMLWSARGIATVITRPDTNHGPSFIQGHSYEIV